MMHWLQEAQWYVSQVASKSMAASLANIYNYVLLHLIFSVRGRSPLHVQIFHRCLPLTAINNTAAADKRA
jgi:hypothetical protein